MNIVVSHMPELKNVRGSGTCYSEIKVTICQQNTMLITILGLCRCYATHNLHRMWQCMCIFFYHLRDALQVKLQVQTVREVFFKFWKMLSSLWIQGENVHWMSHFKDQLQAIMQYACNLANTSNLWIQSIKRVVPWAADYFTHNSLYFPVGKQSTPHIAISRMSYFKLKRSQIG